MPAAMYGTVATGDEYFADRLHEVAWSQSTTDDRRRALVSATRIIDTLSFKGNKSTVYALLTQNPQSTNAEVRAAEAAQELEFPRGSDTDVPTAILHACYEIAYALLDGIDPQLELEALGITSQGLESVRTTYARNQKPVEHIINGVPSYPAWRLIRPYLRDGREVTVTRVN